MCCVCLSLCVNVGLPLRVCVSVWNIQYLINPGNNKWSENKKLHSVLSVDSEFKTLQAVVSRFSLLRVHGTKMRIILDFFLAQCMLYEIFWAVIQYTTNQQNSIWQFSVTHTFHDNISRRTHTAATFTCTEIATLRWFLLKKNALKTVISYYLMFQTRAMEWNVSRQT